MADDGTQVYCLVQHVGDPAPLGLARVDLATGKAVRVLTEFSIVDFRVSRDEQSVAFTADNHGTREIWLAALDRRTPPRRIATNADGVKFGRTGELIYRSLASTANFIERIGTDGRGAARVGDRRITELGDVSPDGEWVVAVSPVPEDPSSLERIAVPLAGGPSRKLCDGLCKGSWSPDGRYAVRAPFVYPLQPGKVFPDSFSTDAPGWIQLPDTQRPDLGEIAPGPNPSIFVFTIADQRGNLFRVPIR